MKTISSLDLTIEREKERNGGDEQSKVRQSFSGVYTLLAIW
jgi:hypothetical protein